MPRDLGHCVFEMLFPEPEHAHVGTFRDGDSDAPSAEECCPHAPVPAIHSVALRSLISGAAAAKSASSSAPIGGSGYTRISVGGDLVLREASTISSGGT